MVQDTRPKILYIDDTTESRLLVRRILERDYVVLEANDGLGGIELAIDTQPNLILIDINLPQLSGHEVATRLRTLLPNTPLVAFTADLSKGARERALAAGCVGYLTKPLNVDTFSKQVAEFLQGKQEALPAEEAAAYQQAYQADLVERLEVKVRELTKTATRKDFLNEQNERMIAELQRRQRMLEAGARVGQSITSILDLDQLLHATVNIICGEYGFYYAGIFLIDDTGAWAALRAGHGAPGAAMLAANYRLEVGGDSTVGMAISERAARIAHDVGAEQAFFKNPYLPDTRSEIVLPLIVKEDVLGALTVQSTELEAFSADDITALESLAGQIAIAINNAQLLRDLEAANEELVRTKTFEAIASATGEAIHWVGNKAAPVPGSAQRVRADLLQLLAVFRAVLSELPETREQHPLWPAVQATFQAAAEQAIDLSTLASELATLSPKQMQRQIDLESILEDLDIIQQSAATILAIKEDLIGPAREQHISAIALPELLEHTIAGMGLPDGVVQPDYAADAPPVLADARQLDRVFLNLIKNAWEALQGHPQPRIGVKVSSPAHSAVPSAPLRTGPGGGSVAAPEAGFAQDDDGSERNSYRVKLDRAADPTFAQVQISDNGPGIPPEILDKIWVSFFTTKGDRGGTGLGLAACLEIVNQAGGKITVDSEVGVGTAFTVLLPVAKEDRQHANRNQNPTR